MYIVIQKGVRAWGIGATPVRAMQEAVDHGAGKVPSRELEIFPCTRGVWRWFTNTLYPEEVDMLVFRADGVVGMMPTR